MAVAEQQDRKYAPCPKSATAFKKTVTSVWIFFSKLMILFPSSPKKI